MDPRLWRQVGAAKQLIIGLGIGSAINGFLILGQAWMLARIVSRVYLHHAAWPQVAADSWLLLAIIVARALVAGINEHWALHYASVVESRLRRDFIRYLTTQHPGAASWPESGELINLAVQGIDDLEVFLARYFPQVIVTATVPAIVWVGLMARDWISGLIVLLTLPLIPIFMIFIGQQADKQSRQQLALLNRLNGHFLDVLHGLETLKLFGRSRQQTQVVAHQSEQFRRTTLATLRIAFLSGLVLELIASLSMAFIAVAIGLRLIHALIPFETAFMVLVLVPEFYIPWRSLGAKFHDGLKGANAARAIFNLIEKEPAIAATGHHVLPTPGPWLMEWRHVSFQYPGRQDPALDHVTVTLPPSAHLAIVGPSGSGKSTFLHLLLGELEYQGDILVDGVNLKTLDPTWWREQMAWVTQRPYFFSGTIWDNLIRVAPRATPEQVEWALMEAGAWDFIQRLPMGWHTPIGQEGQMLSGGQRQRLALTRAFLLNRPIVIFDEPSQNLDLPTEAALMRGMERLQSGRTTITIAHRLLTVARADYVLVLNRGRVEQAGAPADLARMPGLYRSLVEAYEQRRDWDEPLQADPIV